MKRLVKNSIYFVLIVVVVAIGAINYESPSDGGIDWGDFPVTIPEQWRGARSPQEQINLLADLMHVRYPDNITITGSWGVRPMSNTTYIDYDIHVNYKGAKETAELPELIELEKRVIGELAIASARMRLIETDIPGIGTNVLNEMAIKVSKAYVARRSLEEEPTMMYRDVPDLGNKMDKMAYMFERDGVRGLAKETNPLNWMVYAKPIPFGYKYPNEGMEDAEVPPDAESSEKP